jgi:integrase/recombinase XerD
MYATGTYLETVSGAGRGLERYGGGVETLAGAWLVSLQADTTRAAYRNDLTAFLSYLVARGVDPMTAPRAVVDLWLTEMKAAGLAASTRARRLSAVRSFYAYALEEGAITHDPTARVKPPYVSPEPVKVGLGVVEARAVVAAAMMRTPAHRATVALLLGAALRVSEAAAADVEHIRKEDGHTVLAVTGKGERRRLVPLSPLALELLDPLPLAGPLVRNAAGDRCDRFQLAHMVRSIGKAAGLERPISPHILRHTAATLALDGGAQVHKVADLLGHASPTTTMRYVAGRERLRDNAAYVVAGALAGGA